MLLSAGTAAGSRAGRAVDLAVDITPTSFAGGRMDYLVAIDNQGPVPARGAVFSARLPAGRLLGVQVNVLDLAGPRCTRRARNISCALDTVPPQSYAEVVISMRAPRGSYVLTARVSSRDPDPYPWDNTARARIDVP